MGAERGCGEVCWVLLQNAGLRLLHVKTHTGHTPLDLCNRGNSYRCVQTHTHTQHIAHSHTHTHTLNTSHTHSHTAFGSVVFFVNCLSIVCVCVCVRLASVFIAVSWQARWTTGSAAAVWSVLACSLVLVPKACVDCGEGSVKKQALFLQ